MAVYLVRRVLQTIAFVFVAVLFVFTFLIYFISGGPGKQYWNLTDNIGTPSSNPPSYVQDEVNNLVRQYKLDRPWPISFLAWLYDPNDTTRLDDNNQPVPKGIDIAIGDLHIKGSGILTLDLGRAVSRSLGRRPISELLADRWGVTTVLMSVSLLIALVIAIPTGIISAVKQRSKLDHLLSFFSFGVLSLPPFVLGLLFITFFSVLPQQLRNNSQWTWLPYLPISGVTDYYNRGDFLNYLYHLVLPALTLGLIQGMWLSRHIRSAMLEVLRQEYVRVARAKGLPMRRVVLKHALRNALIPLCTALGLLLPALASGAMVIESVFNYPGMGLLFFRSLGGCIDLTHESGCPPIGRPPDYTIALILLMISIILVALSNLLADFLYTLADPRINYSSKV